MTVWRTEKILLNPLLSILPTSLYLKRQADFYPISPFIIVLLIYINKDSKLLQTLSFGKNNQSICDNQIICETIL